ncbi:MAG: TM2 domain-containing membrane protein YozV [Marinoscillum sp.]|jgi:TM2 domain-containing membrane protein YozV
MKKSFLLALALMVSLAGFSNSKYSIDDSKVEAAFEQSMNVTSDLQINNAFSTESIQEDKNVWIAVALDFFLGGLGVHRVYLGTPPGIIAGYFFTCGGIFGILPLVDLIVLVINNDDISGYINKKGLIMFN